MRAGQPVDRLRPRGQQRSVHNTYFVMPVLFAMLSNHYPVPDSGPNNWLVLVAVDRAGGHLDPSAFDGATQKWRRAGQPLGMGASRVWPLLLAWAFGRLRQCAEKPSGATAGPGGYRQRS